MFVFPPREARLKENFLERGTSALSSRRFTHFVHEKLVCSSLV
jgi:hypothetical protein